MSYHSHVVVGYDGTDQSERAVRWAADAARRRRVPLTVCHAWRWPYPISYIDYEGVAIVKRMGQNILAKGASIAQDAVPGLTVRTRLMDGPASSGLLHEAFDAEMVVLGSHESSEELPLGSTSLQVPARAKCPVVVVRGAAPRTGGDVVVGVSGSDGDDAVLEFAFEEAALHDRRVRAVYGCWEASAVSDSELALYADAEELKRVCGTRLERAVSPWRTKYPHLQVTTSLVQQDPRMALLDAAQNAVLLVVGDRGERGPHPLLLGSTSLPMLQHAPCTIAVVRLRQRP